MYSQSCRTIKSCPKKEELNRKLCVFKMTVMQCIAAATHKDRIRNVFIRKNPGVITDVVNRVRAKRLSYFGQVVRVQPNSIPDILLWGRVSGKRPIGRPKKRWLDKVKEDCLTNVLITPWSVNSTDSRSCRLHCKKSDVVQKCCQAPARACRLV